MKTSKVTLDRIIDGDTVVTKGKRLFFFDANPLRIRLYGIDAPESEQKGGTESTNTLKKLASKHSKKIYLTEVAKDKYGRTVGIIGHGASNPQHHYNLQMLREGQAHCYMLEQNSPFREEYEEAEAEAKKKRLGIWKAAQFDRPADFRRRQDAADARRTSAKRYLYAGIILLAASAVAYYLWADDVSRIWTSLTSTAASLVS